MIIMSIFTACWVTMCRMSVYSFFSYQGVFYKTTGIALFPVAALRLPLAAAERTKWTIDASGFYLTRTAGSKSPLVSLYANAGTDDIMKTKDVALTSWKPGVDLKVAYALNEKLGVEVRGFFLAKSSKSFNNVNSSEDWLSYAIETDPASPYGRPSGSHITAENNANALKSIEANVTYVLTPAVSLYGGFRFIQLNESFAFDGGLEGSWDELELWNAKNNMWGVQIGARADILSLFQKEGGNFTINGHAGLALFLDKTKSDFTIDGTPFTDPISDSKLSPAVDAGLRFGYRVNGMIEVQQLSPVPRPEDDPPQSVTDTIHPGHASSGPFRNPAGAKPDQRHPLTSTT